MAGFDIAAATAAGYSPEEIQQFVQQQGAALNIGAPRGVQQGGTYFQDPSTPEWQAKWGPLSGMNEGQQALVGAGRGMVHTGQSLGNLAGLVPNSTLTESAKLDAPLMASPAGRFGNIAGEAALTAPLGMGAGALASKIPAVGPILNAATQGGVQGLATSDPGDRGLNTLVGALTGGGLGAAGRVGSKAIYGATRTPEAQFLLNRGVSLTPGQMNPGGAMNQFEQAIESIPGAKQVVHGARESAEQDFQRSVIESAAVPGTKIKPSENVSDMLQQAYDSYAPLYDQAKGYPVSPVVMRVQGGNIPLSQAFTQAARAPGVPASLQKSENAWLQDRLTQLSKNPQSEDLLQLRSDIRQRARLANLKSDTNSSHVANINGRADQAVSAALHSQLPPEPLQALASADANYGNYKIVENAIARSKDNIAGLTPAKLSQAIYDASADPAYARGAGGDLRQLAKAGTSVFQTVVPPTGARVATLGAGLAGAMAAPKLAIPIGTGMLGLSGTQTGRRLAAGMTRPQTQAQRLAAALTLPAPVPGVVNPLLTRAAVGAGMPVVQQYAPQTLSAALMMLPQAPQR